MHVVCIPAKQCHRGMGMSVDERGDHGLASPRHDNFGVKINGILNRLDDVILDVDVFDHPIERGSPNQYGHVSSSKMAWISFLTVSTFWRAALMISSSRSGASVIP